MRMPQQESRYPNRSPQQRKETKRANPQQTHSVVATDTVENDTYASAYTLFKVSSSTVLSY